MLKELQPGATVEHKGMTIGSVEQVQEGQILVRHGRADYLLRIADRYLSVRSPSRVEIDATLELDEVEKTAMEAGRAPPTGEHIDEAAPTAPSPSAEGVAGRSPGMPLAYDGPATG